MISWLTKHWQREGSTRPSLRVQLLWAFALAAALPVLIFGLVQGEAWSSSESAHANRETLLASATLGREAERQLDTHADVVRAMAAELGERGRLEEPELSQSLRRYRLGFPGFYMTLAIRADGVTIRSDPALGPDGHAVAGTSYRDRPYFQRVVAGSELAVSDTLTSRTTGQPAVILAAPIRDGSGKLLGVASAGVDLAVFRHAIASVTSTVPELHGVVLDSSGKVVASAGKRVFPALTLLGRLPFYRPSRGLEPEHRSGDDGAGVASTGTHAPVRSRVVTWSVVTALPDASVSLRANRAFRTMAAFALGALLIGLFSAAILSRWVARPIAAASALVQAIGRGDLRVKADPTKRWHSHEVTHLAASLKDTRDHLLGLITELGKTAATVYDVTGELGNASAQMVNDSRAQEQAVRTSSGAIEQMTDSIGHVTRSVRELSTSADETTRSIVSLDQQIEMIGGNLDILTRAIGRAGRSLEQVTGQVEALFKSADQLGHSVHHTAASLATLTESIDTVSVGAEQSQALANDVILAADAGSGAVNETMTATRQMREDFQAVRAAVQRLADRSEAIEQVAAVISDVARATHVLAINASIIASQAGEHGKRFAVVADRVRVVASDTAASTQQITELVASVQADIRKAVEAVERGQGTVQTGEQRSEEAGRRLRLIIESSTQAELQVRQIGEAARQQSGHVRAVEAALDEVRSVTEHIDAAAHAQQTTHQELKDAVTELVDVGEDVQRSTERQRTDSRAMTLGVRTITERLSAIATAIQAQDDEREHIASSLEIFNAASLASVKHALKIEASVAALSERLAVLERQMRSFRVD